MGDSRVPVDEVVFFDFITSRFDTGAATDADSTPTFEVFEEATDTDIGIGGNATKRSSKTGNYRLTFTASAANGFEAGKWYSVVASATVNSVAGKGVVAHFQVVPAESVAGVAKVDIADWLGSAPDALSSGKVPTDVKLWLTSAPNALQSGRVDSYIGAIAAAVIASGSFAANALDAVWSTASRLLTAGTNIVLAKGTGVTGFNDLSAAQVNAEADTALSDYDGPTHAEMTAELATADDATLAQIALVKAKTDQFVFTVANQVDANAITGGGTAPTAAENADAVWDELRAGHTLAGSFGQASQAARSAAAAGGALGYITLDAGASAADDFYNGLWVAIVAGTGIGQIREISDYNGTSKQASVTEDWGIAPYTDSIYAIF